jgi:hypothetical protein
MQVGSGCGFVLDSACESAREHEATVLISLLRELWAFMSVRKKYWLIPVILVLLTLGGLLLMAQGSVVAPFIYTLF